MNKELLDKLQFQAAAQVNPLLKDREWQRVYIQKYTELIVRECMSQIETVRGYKAGNAGPVYTQGFEDGMFVAIRTIEEHFGVEE